MQRLFALVVVGISALGSAATSQQLIVEDKTSFSDAAIENRRSACMSEATKVLTKRFDGLTSVTIADSHFWTSVVNDVENYAFANSRIVSDFGDVEAQILCLVYTQANAIVEISFQFSPPLKGGRRSPSPDIGSSSFVSQNTIQITGAN